MPAKEFVARRALQTGSGVARLFRKRICTFEKRGEGATREPARWFDKENGGGGGVMESDGSTLPVIEQTGRYRPFLFLTHRRQPSTFPTVGDFYSQPLPCLHESKISDK